MAGSYNRAILIGRLGKDPEKRTFQNGGSVVNFSLATSESWRDKATGEKMERTQWHNISIFNEKIGDIACQYLHKGDLISIEGTIETRKWTDQEGITRYTTEIVLRPFNGSLSMLQSKDRSGGGEYSAAPSEQRQAAAPATTTTTDTGYQTTQGSSIEEDEIPF